HPGRTGLALVRTGQPALSADLFVVGVRFSGPDPVEIGAGDDAQLEARIEGLPPQPGEPGAPPWPARDKDRPIVTIVYRNDSRETVTGIRTKRKGGWEDEGQLFIPIRFDSLTPGGVVVVDAKAHGRSKGQVRVGERFILDEELTRPL